MVTLLERAASTCHDAQALARAWGARVFPRASAAGLTLSHTLLGCSQMHRSWAVRDEDEAVETLTVEAEAEIEAEAETETWTIRAMGFSSFCTHTIAWPCRCARQS